MATTFHKTANNATGTLASSINDTAMSFSLSTGEGALYPISGPFWVTAEDEIIECSSRTSDTFTVSERGAQGTIATSHASGVEVNLYYTSEQISEIQDAVNSAEENIEARVVGPGSSTDNAVPRFNGTDVKEVKDSGVIIDDSNNITGVNSLTTATIISTGALNFRAYGNNYQHIDYDNNSTTSYFRVRANDTTDVLTVSETGNTTIAGSLTVSGFLRPWSMWVPASQFVASSGSPTLATWTGSGAMKHSAWFLDQSSIEELSCIIVLPTGYSGQSITTEIIWTGDSAGSGVVRWIYRGNAVTDGETMALAFNADVEDTYQGADITHIATSASTEAASRVFCFGVGRRADNANDTLAQDAIFLGAMISIL